MNEQRNADERAVFEKHVKDGIVHIDMDMINELTEIEYRYNRDKYPSDKKQAAATLRLYAEGLRLGFIGEHNKKHMNNG